MITLVISEEQVCLALALLVMGACWVWVLCDCARNPRRPSPVLAHPWLLATLQAIQSWDLRVLNRDYEPDTGRPTGGSPPRDG